MIEVFYLIIMFTAPLMHNNSPLEQGCRFPEISHGNLEKHNESINKPGETCEAVEWIIISNNVSEEE